MGVHIFSFFTPGTQCWVIIFDCLSSLKHFSLSLFQFLTLFLLLVHPSSPFSCSSLCVSQSSILVLSLYASFHVCQSSFASLLIIPLFQPVYVSVSFTSSLSLSPSLRSLTYLHHSCLMNNGRETVTISVSISRILPLISAPLPFPPDFPHNFSLLLRFSSAPFLFQLLTSAQFHFILTVCTKKTTFISTHTVF